MLQKADEKGQSDKADIIRHYETYYLAFSLSKLFQF